MFLSARNVQICLLCIESFDVVFVTAVVPFSLHCLMR